ncbi:YbbR-like domain-containing protein [Bacillus salitolerans]|uniref:YbbR-like domain-containing protein n=1 Tax=Bacillus salitolerans TaxID=1437434 RepID=A0ABW4LS48_9BACI
MDKFTNNRWVMKIIALLFALILYTSVNIETQTKQTEPISFPVVTNETETLTEVPLQAYYNMDQYVISGVPEFVTVTLDGPRSAVQPVKLQRSIETFIDIEALDTGAHNVKVQYKGVNDNVEVQIDPAFVTVHIHEKVEAEFSVEVDYINELKDGYTLDKPIINPKHVKVVGAREQVERIALVKAIVDLKDETETIKQEAQVAVYDSDGNRLNVQIEPATVNVTIPIISPNKLVSFKLIPKGTPEDGYSIVGLEPAQKEITIFGPKEVLDKIDTLGEIEVDINEISEDTVKTINIPIPPGIKDLSPKTIDVQIKIEKNELRTLTNVPINVIGLPNSLSATFIRPDEGVVDIELIGPLSILKDIDETDLDIYIDVTNLGSGEHEVEILVNGPDSIKWNLSSKSAIVELN